MGTTGTTHTEGGFEAPSNRGGPAEGAESPTQQLIAPAVGDRCVTCQAPLVSDQRYCLNCGERRGTARFSFESLAAPPPPPPPPPVRRTPRASAGATLVTGVATLLLAMGVGVLIGHSGNNSNARPAAAAPPQVITVGGGGSAASSTPQQARRQANNALKAPKIVITKKVAQAATAAAGKVLGGSANLAPPTVNVGSKCTHGAGCQGGKFTGTFFGGG